MKKEYLFIDINVDNMKIINFGYQQLLLLAEQESQKFIEFS
jgi:hypothetical protein